MARTSSIHGVFDHFDLYWICSFVCFWFSGPLRQYFSLYRAVPKREGEDERKDRGE